MRMQIRDGRRGTDRLIGRYCGSDETGHQLTTTVPGAVVRFHSDGSPGGQGFNIAFNAKQCTCCPSYYSRLHIVVYVVEGKRG